MNKAIVSMLAALVCGTVAFVALTNGNTASPPVDASPIAPRTTDPPAQVAPQPIPPKTEPTARDEVNQQESAGKEEAPQPEGLQNELAVVGERARGRIAECLRFGQEQLMKAHAVESDGDRVLAAHRAMRSAILIIMEVEGRSIDTYLEGAGEEEQMAHHMGVMHSLGPVNLDVEHNIMMGGATFRIPKGEYPHFDELAESVNSGSYNSPEATHPIPDLNAIGNLLERASSLVR